MKKLTNTEIIRQFREVHGNKYDYSLIDYKGNIDKVKIICLKHGVFEQIPKDHKRGLCCAKCRGLNKTTEDVIEEFKKIHGDKYSYSFVDYNGSSVKVKINCHKHGIFYQKPNHHLRGVGCPKCGGKYKLSTREVVIQFKKVHGNKYKYSLVDYKNDNHKVVVVCEKHGEFLQKPTHHKQGRGCPTCKNSKGEIMVSNILNKNLIKYNIEKKFDECRNIMPLPFDFYLINENICIEFHGRQHFKMECHFGHEDGFKKNKKRDKIKESFCKENKISLIIIFETARRSKKYKFVDLYKNSSKNIRNILLDNDIKQINKIQYDEFKNSFN